MGIEIEGALIVSRLKLSALIVVEDNTKFEQVIHVVLNMNDVAELES